MRVRRITLLVLLLAAGGPAQADLEGQMEFELRTFRSEPSFPGPQETYRSAAAEVEYYHRWGRRRNRFVATVFGRRDDGDPNRTHGDVREFSYVRSERTREWRVGIRRVFWGVTESRHLVDIINQTDAVEGIDGEEKFGQPMVNLALIRREGTLDLFVLPRFRERSFPGETGRPRLEFDIDEESARYESDRKRRHVDYAARWRQSAGAVDYGVSVFRGTARAPRLVPCLREGSGFPGTENGPNCDLNSARPTPSDLDELLLPLAEAAGLGPDIDALRRQAREAVVLVPHYDQITQLGIDLQWVYEAWAWKLELARRWQRDEVINAAVGGFEYTFGDVRRSGMDIGVLVEYLYDDRNDPFGTRVDDDLFAGTRIAWNDVAGTQLLAGVIRDRQSTNSAWGVEASRRFGSDWKAELEIRAFTGIDDSADDAFLENEDFATLRLQRYF